MKTNLTRMYPETKILIEKLVKDGYMPLEASGTDARQIHWLVRYADLMIRQGNLNVKVIPSETETR